MRYSTSIALSLLFLLLPACGGGGGGPGPMTDPGDEASNPTILATGLTFQDPMAAGAGTGLGTMLVDATNLYWFQFEQSGGNTGGSIRCVPQAGGAVTTLANGVGGVNALTCDDTHIYYTEFDIATGAGTLKRVPKAGGMVEALYPNNLPMLGVAVNATHVFVASPEFGDILRLLKDGSGATQIGEGTGASLAVDATHVYFIEGITGMQGRLRRVVHSGGMTETLEAMAGVNLNWLGMDATTLYWTSVIEPRTNLMRPIAAGPIATIETNGTSNVAFDATHIYFTRNDVTFGTLVLRRPKGGGMEETLGKGGTLGAVFQIGVNGGSVFLLDVGGGVTGAGRVLKL